MFPFYSVFSVLIVFLCVFVENKSVLETKLPETLHLSCIVFNYAIFCYFFLIYIAAKEGRKTLYATYDSLIMHTFAKGSVTDVKLSGSVCEILQCITGFSLCRVQ